MNNDELVPTLVDAAIARLRRMDMCRTPLPNMPEAMRDHDIPTTNGWLGWKPVGSTVTDADIQDLERKLNLQFPSLYKQLSSTVISMIWAYRAYALKVTP